MKQYSQAVTSPAYHVTRTLTGVKCDICGKVIPAVQGTGSKTRYFEVITGHNDWGNDSCESVYHRDICPECIDSFMSEYLSKAHGSEYMEVNTKYSFPMKNRTVVDTPPKENEVYEEDDNCYW